MEGKALLMLLDELKRFVAVILKRAVSISAKDPGGAEGPRITAANISYVAKNIGYQNNVVALGVFPLY